MKNKLFIGNINWDASDEELEEHFSEYGNIEEAVIITEKGTGRSKGFGFVTFETEEEAQAAKEALDGQEFQGRTLAVKEARPDNK